MGVINTGGLTKIFYYINISLTQTYKSLGQYEVIKNDEIIGSLTSFNLQGQTTLAPFPTSQPSNVTISGLTKSRLDEVITYSKDYRVGVNGVLLVLSTLIIYQIDNIVYQTLLDGSNTTFYSTTKQTNEFESQNIIGNNDSVFVDIKKTLNAFLINRSNIPVYDYFNKINKCDELDDLLEIF